MPAMVARDLDLTGQVALVTGAASGIGLETARRFVALGAAVLAIDASGDELVQTKLADEGSAGYHEADVTDEAAVRRAIDAAQERWGRIDVLANVAGIFGAGGAVADVQAESVMRVYEVNVLGPVLMLKHSVGALRETRGSVINVTSSAADRPPRKSPYYGASKAALTLLTRSWALELGADGIRVNAVAPGPTDTPVLARAGMSKEEIEAVRRQATERTPFGRRAQPEDIALWIVRFADPDSFATGQVLTVDGGLSLT
jgi:NAD(P)-dependent dehydrogenase (short-subunit alcohol dehydrogenase family)